jgi:pyruvate,water dikinase
MSGAKRLEGGLPLTMHVIDLGEGLEPDAADKKVISPDDIASPLMRASWAGLADPAVNWADGPAVLDWEEADRLSGGIVSLKSAVFGSYAAVAGEYLHLVLRFGYHFAVLDAFGGEDAEANYINFRFKGGGGNYENRLLRVRLIESVLTWAGFAVAIRGDLLEAGFQRRPLPEILGRLTLLGILQGKCRLLDMSLSDPDQVEEMVESLQTVLERYLKKD